MKAPLQVSDFVNILCLLQLFTSDYNYVVKTFPMVFHTK